MRLLAKIMIVAMASCADSSSLDEGECTGKCDGHHGGHGGMPAAPPMIRPAPWTGTLATATFTDQNPDPKIVEVSLTAAMTEVEYLPGKRARVWAYNGSVPGPTLEAKVGDRVIVHFTNNLPEPTTIHWHGVRVTNAMDGTHRVMEPIAPGATFEYDFTVIDAGTFWYHPHVRGAFQMEKGLYGGFIVRDAAEPAIPSTAEEVVVLDDVLVDPATGALKDLENARTMMMGLEGNLLLVNGARSNMGISVRAGEWRRWRVVNAALSRYVKLSMVSGDMIRIGGDGGLLAAPQTATELLLVPGERADVLVSARAPGTTATLRAVPYERADGAGATESIDVLRLVATTEPARTPAAVPSSLRAISMLAPSGPTRTIRLGEMVHGSEMMFTINGEMYPDVPVINSSLGTVETWNIVNETAMDHPFHLHGFFFQRQGAGEWKDTINIPANATVRLLVDFEDHDGAAGGWMYHCHIIGHQEGGMMGDVMTR